MLVENDIPQNWQPTSVAIDTETMGLVPGRDRLCLVQMCDQDNKVLLVQIKAGYEGGSPNLARLLQDPHVLKIFHFARFDLAMLQKHTNVLTQNIFCTKIASKLARTYASGHGLKELCDTLLKVNISKTQQTSDWGKANLSQEQLQYATNDVIYLHRIYKELLILLTREGRLQLAEGCFSFLPYLAELDCQNFVNVLEYK